MSKSINEIHETDSLNVGRKKLNNAIRAFNETVKEGDSSLEAAQARVDEKGQSHTTLKERIDDGFTKVNTQLVQRPTLFEVNNLLQPKRDKSVKLELEDMSEAVLSAIEGGEGTNFNLLSIPQDESVTIQKVAKETFEETTKRAVYEQWRQKNDLRIKFNDFGDVNDTSFLDSLRKSTKIGNVSFTNNTTIEVEGKQLKTIEIEIIEFDSNANAYLSYDQSIDIDKDYFVGAWYYLPDLIEIANERLFNPFIHIYDIDNDSGGFTGSIGNTIINEGIPSEKLSEVGYKFTSTGINGALETEVMDVYRDWVFLRTKYIIYRHEAKSIRHYFIRFVNPEQAHSLRMSTPILSDREINPYINPYASSDEYKSSQSESGSPISKWTGKKWFVFGDSNSNRSHIKAYHSIIADEIGCEVTNYAIGGAGYVRPDRMILDQIASADDDADLITLMAGGNDYSIGYPLGKLGDTTMDTFYGAVDTTINALIDKYPLKKIGVFAQMRRRNEGPNGEGVTVEDQVNATIEVCRKYGIPVLDLYHEGNMRPWNDDYYSYAMEDTAHLTNEGQALITPIIRSFLETL